MITICFYRAKIEIILNLLLYKRTFVILLVSMSFKMFDFILKTFLVFVKSRKTNEDFYIKGSNVRY